MNSKDAGLGLFFLALSLITLLVWIPADIDSGLIEKVRRSVQLGDAFAPTIAASIVLTGAAILLAESLLLRKSSLRRKASDNTASPARRGNRLELANAGFALMVLCLLLLALTLMRFAGPVLVQWFDVGQADYRLLRDSAPWKYTGYIIGGSLLVSSLIALSERRLRPLHLLIGLAATLALIALYDLPFDDLLLPPNGDV